MAGYSPEDQAPSVLSLLASSLKTHGMYPAGHPSLERMLAMLHQRFEQYLRRAPTLSVGIGKDTLFVGERELGGEDWIVNLALALHSHSISKITFHRGLSEEELRALLRILRLDPLTVRNSGGYAQYFAEQRVRSIEVHEVEYRLYEGDLEAQLERLSDVEVWRRIAERFSISGIALGDEDLRFVQRLIQDAPRLATIVDAALAGRAEGTAAAEAAAIFFRAVEALAPASGDAGGEDRQAFEGQVLRVLSALSPQGCYALLEDSMTRIEHEPDKITSVDHLLNKLEDRELARALIEGLDPRRSHLEDFCRTYSNFADEQHELALLSEIESIVMDRDLKHDSTFAAIIAQAEQLPEEQAPLRRLRKTLTRVHQAQLNRSLPIYDYIEAVGGRPAELLDRFKPEAIEESVCLNLLNILRFSRDTEHYEFYAEGLDYLIANLIQTGRYALADQAVKLLRMHADKRNKNEASRQIARRMLTALRTPEVVDELLRALSTWGKEQSDAIVALLMGMGQAAVEPVIKALDAEQNRAVRVAMINVLTQAGEHVLPLIEQRMQGADWFVLRNMITLLSQINPPDLAQRLAPTVAHAEPRVRKVAARSLIATADPAAVDLLIRLIDDQDEGVRQQAILSLGHFRGSEAACRALLARLEQRHPFNGDQRSEELALETLGKLRLAESVPLLARYVSGSGLLGGPSEELRVIAAKSLAGINDPQCRELLKQGCKSHKKGLREACQQLLQSSEEG